MTIRNFVLHKSVLNFILISFFCQDILIEAEVVAPGSINGVLSGKHYNRSVRSHKVVYESMTRLLLECYFESLQEEEQRNIDHMIGQYLFISIFCKISILLLNRMYTCVYYENQFLFQEK